MKRKLPLSQYIDYSWKAAIKNILTRDLNIQYCDTINIAAQMRNSNLWDIMKQQYSYLQLLKLASSKSRQNSII